MSPAIEAIILQLVATCLRITSQGKWHAHIQLAAHVRLLDIYILPATALYQEGETRERALSQAVYYQTAPAYSWETEAQQEARAAHELEALLLDLQPYLAASAKEAAA